jgi:hypothetical protein
MQRVAKFEALLARTDRAIRSEGRRLLTVYELLPAALKKPRVVLAERLRAALDKDPKAEDVPVPERLRLLTTFAGSLHGALRSAHVAKRMVEDGNGRRREMDVLYMGAAVGYYVSPTGDEAGSLVRRAGVWKAVPRDGIASEVREAIAILRKERPARLVWLPLLNESDEGGAP